MDCGVSLHGHLALHKQMVHTSVACTVYAESQVQSLVSAQHIWELLPIRVDGTGLENLTYFHWHQTKGSHVGELIPTNCNSTVNATRQIAPHAPRMVTFAITQIHQFSLMCLSHKPWQTNKQKQLVYEPYKYLLHKRYYIQYVACKYAQLIRTRTKIKRAILHIRNQTVLLCWHQSRTKELKSKCALAIQKLELCNLLLIFCKQNVYILYGGQK